MSRHSITEAREQLSDLIDRALMGEPVVILRDGHPVAEIKPVTADRRAAREADLAWLDANRVKPRGEGDDAITVLLKMRDEAPP